MLDHVIWLNTGKSNWYKPTDQHANIIFCLYNYAINTYWRDTQCFMMATCICEMWSQLYIIPQTKYVLIMYTHKKGGIPFPRAYCVLHYFCLSYGVPFNNKINQFWRLHLQYDDKITVWCMHIIIQSSSNCYQLIIGVDPHNQCLR